MRVPAWIRNVLSTTSSVRKKNNCPRLHVEMLEDRLTPTGGIHAPITADNTVTTSELHFPRKS